MAAIFRKPSVIVVDVKSSKTKREPVVASRLKSRQPPARGMASPEKATSSLAATKRAKVAATHNKRVNAVMTSRALKQNTQREKLEAKIQRGLDLAEFFNNERKTKASKVVAKHTEIVAKVTNASIAEVSANKTKLAERLSAAESKRATELEQIANRASLRNAQVDAVKARNEVKAAEFIQRISDVQEAAEENRRKSLEAVRAKAAVNAAGIPHHEVTARVKLSQEQEKVEFANKLANKLEAAAKKHEDHVESVRSKAASVASRAASVAEAQSTSSSNSPGKLMSKIQDTLVHAESKRLEFLESVKGKATKIVERHTTVVSKQRELTTLRAKTAMLNIEVKLAAAESRRNASLSPRKSPRPHSPRISSPAEAVPFPTLANC